MQKKVFGMAALIAAMVGVGYTMTGEDKEPMSALLLENVEALASGEISGPHHCYGAGTVDCPFNHRKVEIVYSGYSLGDSLY